MIKLFLSFAAALLFLSVSAHSQEFSFQSGDEKILFEYWKKNGSLDRGLLECLLIAEGSSEQMEFGKAKIARLETEAKNFVNAKDYELKRGERLYQFVHARVLRKYSAGASDER